MFRVSTTPIIRSTQNCNYSLRYWSYFFFVQLRHSNVAKLGLLPVWRWRILCLWFRASLIYINSCPTRCNTKQSIYYPASSLYMFRVSTTSIIRSTQNCNYSLRYWSYILCSCLFPTWPTWPRWREVTAQNIWPVPEAVVTVLCTPDDGCGWHAKHVEWTAIGNIFCAPTSLQRGQASLVT